MDLHVSFNLLYMNNIHDSSERKQLDLWLRFRHYLHSEGRSPKSEAKGVPEHRHPMTLNRGSVPLAADWLITEPTEGREGNEDNNT